MNIISGMKVRGLKRCPSECDGTTEEKDGPWLRHTEKWKRWHVRKVWKDLEMWTLRGQETVL